MSDVIRLVTSKPAANSATEPPPPVVAASVVSLLEHLLELARAGDINGVIVVGGREQEGPLVATTGYVDFMLVGAGLSILNEIGSDLLRNT